jgi:transcription elongation factor Elf1
VEGILNKAIKCAYCGKEEVYHIEEVYNQGQVWCSSCGGWNSWYQRVLAKRRVRGEESRNNGK